MKKKFFTILLFGTMILSIIGCTHNKNEFKVGEKSDIEVSSSKVSLSIKRDSISPYGATLVLENNDTVDYEYGAPYEIEIEQNGDWHKINIQIDFILIAYELKAGETKEIELNWENTYGKLSKGTYRIIKTISYKNEEDKYESFNIAVEFTIE